MSQSDYGDLIATNPDGPALGQFLNLFRDALNSGHSGAARPSYAVAGMIWVKDVSPTRRDVLFYGGTEDVLVVAINPTTHAVLEVGGGYTQAQVNALLTPLTTHKNATSNPHSVTAAQVGAYTQAQVDALLIGIDAFEVGAMVLARSGQSLTGFLECDGSTYDETVYTGLVAAGHVEAGSFAATIDLGANGKLTLPIQVGSDVYYYWDLNGDGTPSDLETMATTKGRFTSGGDFGGTEPQITLDGINIVLPELGIASPVNYGNLVDNSAYTGLAALWDAFNGAPTGWPASSFLSSTPYNTSGAWRVNCSADNIHYVTTSTQNSHIAVRVLNPPSASIIYALPDSADFNLPAGYSYYVKY